MIEDDVALLRAAVLDAGEMAMALRRKGLTIESKPGGSPVTNADLAVDAMMKDGLLAARPDYGWLSEETADDEARLSKSRLFVVDPIDGTSAFMRHKDWWSVCAAVVENGRPIAAAVYAPSVNEYYEAWDGGGAFLNNFPIEAGDRDRIDSCDMLGDIRMFMHPEWPTPWPEMRVASRNSIAYRLCLVAAGTFDACLSPTPKHDWDVAAADLIATEAGALVTDHKGRVFTYNRPVPRQRSLVSAGPALHSLLLDRLAHIED